MRTKIITLYSKMKIIRNKQKEKGGRYQKTESVRMTTYRRHAPTAIGSFKEDSYASMNYRSDHDHIRSHVNAHIVVMFMPKFKII